MPDLRPAVFLDRDGVLLEDRGLLLAPSDIRLLDGVPQALARLKNAGFRLIVVSNQAAVARGLISESDLHEIHAEMCRRLEWAGAPPLDAIYYCPHHPHADVAAYRIVCDCRKPQPGLLLRAAREHGLDLARSFLVGDRPSDIAAGARAGCRTAWVQTGQHAAPPIVTDESWDGSCQPDFTGRDLTAATAWILEVR
jgi:D-glycero-D-manno-heptose 1,7-bisphosphate phosphatase